jgi:peptide-methionine (R)-S-oxide reductase
MAEEKPATVGARKSEAELRRTLTAEQYRITQQHGTERAFTHPYNNEKRDGTFACVVCGEPLFTAQAKYDSGSGWPSFCKPTSDDVVSEVEDVSHLMRRTEVRCARCEAHLGHVFPDGPQPTGLRYCINGAALKFEKKD